MHRHRRHAQSRRRRPRRPATRAAGARARPAGAMTWRDAIVVAARSVRRRAGRAVLTVLAVALAATLLTSLLIASGAARRRVLDQVSEGGPLTGIQVAAAAPDPGALDSDAPRQGQAKAIDDAALARIRRVRDVKSIVPVVVNPVRVVPPTPPVRRRVPGLRPVPSSPDDVFQEAIVGVDVRHADDLPISVIAGRLPEPGSMTEVAVSLGYARRFGLE